MEPDLRFDAKGGFFQDVRLVDVLVLGPFMVWYGWRSPKMPDWARLLLILSGVSTVAFNLRNYAVVEREQP